MIWRHVPGFNRPEKETRYGSGEVVTDFMFWVVIDAFMGIGKQVMIKFLKLVKAKEPVLILTHPHCDHGDGLYDIMTDTYFSPRMFICYDPETLRVGLSSNKGSEEVRDDIDYLYRLINIAKKRGIPVKFVDHGDTLQFGEIRINVYRQQPTRVENDDTNGWEYVNNGSLCLYFPDLSYWNSGDGPANPFSLIKAVGAIVKEFMVSHHGNSWNKPNAVGAYNAGARYCWYNHLEPNGVGTTEFTKYGARRCKQAGIKVLNTIGDINVLYFKGRAYVYHDGEVGQYTCGYKGSSVLKTPPVTFIREILKGTYGSSDTRITNVIASGYGPKTTQTKVNNVVNTAIEIKTGTAAGKAYGRNATRLARLDIKFGKGYGQLIQDYINVLYGKRKTV